MNRSDERNSKQGPVDLIREEDFARYLRERLQEDSPALSPHIQRRLRNARHAALAEAQGSSPFYLWKPLAGCASAAALVLSLIYFDGRQATGPGEDFRQEAELLFAEEDLQLYEELDFYRWLATNEL